MVTSQKTSHHHGNLRSALVSSGIEMLEAGEPFSLRAVARNVGVSQTAPYRHFSDKEHLEAAMAAQGFRMLQAELEAALTERGDAIQLADLAMIYAQYAVRHAALYHLMFGQPCGENDERLQASSDLLGLIERVTLTIAPEAQPGLASAGWALAHGLASLYLDGKLVLMPGASLDDRVREAFNALNVP